MSLPDKGILYRFSAWICVHLMGTGAEKRLRRRLREPLCRLHPLAQPEKVLQHYYTKQLQLLLTVLAAGLTITLLAAVMQAGKTEPEQVTALARREYGADSSQETLRVTIGTDGTAEPLDVTISAQTYTQEELEALFEAGAEKLESLVLGENASLDEVTTNLQLVGEIPDTILTVWWQTDHPEVVRADGTLQEDVLTDEGTIVQLTAHLCAQEQEYIHTFAVLVKRAERSPAQEQKEALQETIAAADEAHKTENMLTLPTLFEGQPVSYERGQEEDGIWPMLLVLTAVCMALLLLGKKSELEREMEQRNRQMQLDYPEIVNKLTLLFDAGLSVREAWGRIVKAYVRQCERGSETRYAYEEMLAAYREMEGGMTELEAYDRFAGRCALPGYLKLGALLVQNVKKGTRTLTQSLIYESVQAMEERKSLAKRMGEEAGTKLLVPMVLMLVVVLLILVVPAFLSMGL